MTYSVGDMILMEPTENSQIGYTVTSIIINIDNDNRCLKIYSHVDGQYHTLGIDELDWFLERAQEADQGDYAEKWIHYPVRNE